MTTLSAGRVAPPYARAIRRRRLSRDPWQLNAAVVVTGQGAWELVRTMVANAPEMKHRAITILPPGEDPAQRDWSLLRGLDIMVHDCGGMSITTLDVVARQLVIDGARLVCVVSPLFEAAQFYRPRPKLDAAA